MGGDEASQSQDAVLQGQKIEKEADGVNRTLVRRFMMKKAISLVLCLVLTLSLAACSGAKTPEETTTAVPQEAWPTGTFFKDVVPHAAETVNKVDNYEVEGYHRLTICINDYSYEEFVAYADSLEAAGFLEAYSRANIPSEAPSKQPAVFSSNSVKDACVIATWYPTDLRGYEYSLKIQISERDNVK